MASRQLRAHSSTELLGNVRRARQMAERYGFNEAHPDDYLDKQPDDFDALLSKLK